MNSGALLLALAISACVAWSLRLASLLRAARVPQMPRPALCLIVAGHCLVPTRWIGAIRSHWVGAWLDRELRRAGVAAALPVPDMLALLAGSMLLSALLAVAIDTLPISSPPRPPNWALCGAVLLAPVAALRWLRAARIRRDQALLRELPVGLDMLALLVESGCALPAALQETARHLPSGPFSTLLAELSRQFGVGRSRRDVLREQFEAEQGTPLANTLAALLQAESAGSSLGPVLRAQAAQRTEERFAAAEQAALQAPVRMLLPLVTCIFPCTFIIIAFPLLTRFAADAAR